MFHKTSKPSAFGIAFSATAVGLLGMMAGALGRPLKNSNTAASLLASARRVKRSSLADRSEYVTAYMARYQSEYRLRYMARQHQPPRKSRIRTRPVGNG